MKENLKYWKKQKSEGILHFYLIFCVFIDFYCDFVKRKVHVCLGCTKTRNPGIGTVLHWRPPDVEIFGTDPSLVVIQSEVNWKLTRSLLFMSRFGLNITQSLKLAGSCNRSRGI